LFIKLGIAEASNSLGHDRVNAFAAVDSITAIDFTSNRNGPACWSEIINPT
jgi:hypothetical protein